MLKHPNFDPEIFHIAGPFGVRWYGLMYLVGILSAWLLAKYRIRKGLIDLDEEQLVDLIMYSVLGIVIGGRLGYMVFYAMPTLLAEPFSLFAIWQGGMSFHGGLLGVVAAILWFGKKHGKGFFELTDAVAPLVPLGLGAGRIGNFINGELWGRVTEQPWGMVFATGGSMPRHPSQLYEFALEGVALFAIVWWYSARPRPRMAVSSLFVFCYGLFRFSLEFFREPDPQYGFLAWDWLTMGQVLSFPMILLGATLFILAYQNAKKSEG